MRHTEQLFRTYWVSLAVHLYHWRLNQEPQNAEAEFLPLGHRFISHANDAELTSHGEYKKYKYLYVCVCVCVCECWLRGKGLDMPCDPYWGWLLWFSRTLSHFVSFKNRNLWPQFESCLKSSSDRDAICIKLNLVKSEKFSAWRKYTRNPHSRVIT